MRYKDLQALLRRRYHIPKEFPVRRTIQSFTVAERTAFFFFAALFVLSGLTLLSKVSDAFLVSVPARGGSLTEGVVGNPRFVNPVLALSEADKNLTVLVYSGLVRVTPGGKIENDLAENLSISEDKLSYTATLREDAQFHDGTRVTADDVVFTIQKVGDPMIKSPRRGNWDGVSVEKIDDRTVRFALKKAYTPFIYNLSIGILPRHIWKNVSADEFSFSQFNTLPVGSGPYKVEKAERNEGGIPDYYQLSPFENYSGRLSDGGPFIRSLIFRFYTSEEALVDAYNHGEIESLSGLSPERLSELDSGGSRVMHSPLPRIFAVFFNQSQSKVLLQKEVRQALELSAPKHEIVSEVFGSFATAIAGPLPAGIYPWTAARSSSPTEAVKLGEAKNLLEKAGWKPNEETGVLEKKIGSSIMSLSFSISTGDAPELKKVAEELANQWRKLGAEVLILTFETGELNQSVIRPRHFDALLFGEMVGRDADIYPFWHSSQRNDPGLNIALYANSKADRLLEEARSARNPAAVEESLKAFNIEVAKDVPAVFLYTPSFLYILPTKVKAVELGALSATQDRFAGIRDWYIETDGVWRIFLDN
jgi:peptide/nickel transport system substrate-binding protein